MDASRSPLAAANAFVAIGPCVSRAFLFLRGPTDDRNSGCEHAWYMEAYNCQPQAGQGNIPNRPHSNPDVPFWAEKHAIRASDGAAGRNGSFIFFPAVPSRALSPTPVPVRPKDFADGTGKARTYEYVAGGGVRTASARTAQEREAEPAARQDSIADDRLTGRIA